MRPFMQVYLDLLQAGLTSDGVLAYSLILDRMKSSKKRSEFFDHEEKAYFVIYSYKEMAQMINISERTVAKVFKKMVELNMITLKRQFNCASKIFINEEFQLKFTRHAESASPVMQNLHVNHSNNNHINNTDDTSDTSSEKPIVKTEKQVAQPKPMEATKKSALRKMEKSALVNSLQTKGGLPVNAVKILDSLSFDDPDRLYQYAGLIFKAKAIVKKQAIDVPDVHLALSFEFNEHLSDTLAENLQRIIIRANRLGKNPDGYIMTSLINYFGEIVNEYGQAHMDSREISWADFQLA